MRGDYRLFYQGLFMAPHVTAQSVKTAMLFSQVLSALGYETMPKPNEKFFDIICSVKFGDENKLIDFVKQYKARRPWIALPRRSLGTCRGITTK